MEYIISPSITLKLENGKTNIYVNSQLFVQCHYLLLNLPLNDSLAKINEIKSIDEAFENLNSSMERQSTKLCDISPEQKFQAHCSNLQAWVESGYNTEILHRNIAFPLLRRLVELGDKKAKLAFKEEISRRFSSGYPPIIRFLTEGNYLDNFSDEELMTLYSTTNFSIYDIDLTEYVDNKYIIRLIDSLEPQVLSKIKKLRLHNDDIMPKLISELYNLKELTISNAKTIPNTIGKLKQIQKLWLSHNQLVTVPQFIFQFYSLKDLFLDNNKLMVIPQAIMDLQRLERLSLSHNKLTSIPETFGKLLLIQELDLSYNELHLLPESLGDLHSLFFLTLRNNNLLKIPNSFGKLKSLGILFLSCNKLKTLPKSIANLHSLRDLDLSNNEFSSLPESIGDLHSLEVLSLSYNKLTNIPDSIGNLKSLQELDLSNNRLRNIPRYIEEMKFQNSKLEIHF